MTRDDALRGAADEISDVFIVAASRGGGTTWGYRYRDHGARADRIMEVGTHRAALASRTRALAEAAAIRLGVAADDARWGGEEAPAGPARDVLRFILARHPLTADSQASAPA